VRRGSMVWVSDGFGGGGSDEVRMYMSSRAELNWAGLLGSTSDRWKEGGLEIGLRAAISDQVTQNMLAEYASETRWSNVHPITIAPHFNSVTYVHF